MATAPDMIKTRDKMSAEIARQEDVIYHLILVINIAGQPKRARYIAPFVELASLEQKIQETVQDFSTVIPSGAFLSELLHAPVVGLAGVEEVRIPFHGLDGSISFLVQYEKMAYIKYCYRRRHWTFEKLLYTVVVDTPKKRTDEHEKEEQYVTKVEVEATFSSWDSAVACVEAMVDRWDKEMGKYQGKVISVDRNSMRGVMISPKHKMEVKHVRIITRTLWQAGALKETNGKAVMAQRKDRNGFPKRTRMVEAEQDKSATTTGAGKQNSSTKRTRDDMDQGVDVKATSKRARIEGPKEHHARGEAIAATPCNQNGPVKRARQDEGVGERREEHQMKRIRVVEHVDSGEVEEGEVGEEETT
jgi:hypothetical protein